METKANMKGLPLTKDKTILIKIIMNKIEMHIYIYFFFELIVTNKRGEAQRREKPF